MQLPVGGPDHTESGQHDIPGKGLRPLTVTFLDRPCRHGARTMSYTATFGTERRRTHDARVVTNPIICGIQL